MKNILICGSIAYDSIMVFQDQFKNHILPDQIHNLNICFYVPEMKKNFGGTAGNIAYNLKLLRSNPLIMATHGDDFELYSNWLDSLGISKKYMKKITGMFTAQAFITTDQDDNQITAFHPGAMNHAHINKVSDHAGITLGIVSPDGRQGMIEHAEQFAAAGIPFIFDPGQGMPMFDGADLTRFAEQASYCAFNDYEAKLMEERTGKTMEQLAEMVEAVIVTRGGEGSYIYTQGQRLEIPVAKPDALVDPTGCGDAYRGGLLFGLMKGYDWAITARIASLMGAYKIESQGPQNHSFSMDEFAARFEAAFGMSLPS